MRHAAIFTAIAALALAACGDASKDKRSESAEDKSGLTIPGGNLADADFRMQAGQYRSTVSIQKVSAVGLPAQVTQMMPKQKSFEYCITPAQAAAGLDGVKQQMAQGRCEYESFKASSGNVDAVFSCDAGQGMKLRASSHGTYSDSGSQVAVVGDFAMGGGKAIHVEQTVRAERIGDCGK